MTAMEILAQNMREERKRKHLSQAQLAAKMGVSQGLVYLYEKADREMPLSKIPKLAEALEEPNWIRFLQPNMGKDEVIAPAPSLGWGGRFDFTDDQAKQIMAAAEILKKAAGGSEGFQLVHLPRRKKSRLSSRRSRPGIGSSRRGIAKPGSIAHYPKRRPFRRKPRPLTVR